MTADQPPVEGWLRFLSGWRRTVISSVALFVILVIWTLFTTSVTRTDDPMTYIGPENPESIRSVAYAVEGDGADEIFVRQIDGNSEPRFLMSIPFAFSFRARGNASPDGELVAIVSVNNVSARGSISILSVAGREPVEAEGAYEYLTTIAWRNDASAFSAVRQATPDESGRIAAVVAEIDAATGASVNIATFERVTEAVPVGYGTEGELYVVTIDQGGSSMWSVDAGSEPRLVASLSSGKTHDWALSQDGSRLAYVERIGNQRTDVGHILVVATGQISTRAGENYAGVAWAPGTDVAVFGGPGGDLQFTDSATADSDAYLRPLAWSPDGTTLATEVYGSLDEEGGSLERSLELVTRQSRALLADGPGVQFFGWVVNPDQDGGAGE